MELILKAPLLRISSWMITILYYWSWPEVWWAVVNVKSMISSSQQGNSCFVDCIFCYLWIPFNFFIALTTKRGEASGCGILDQYLCAKIKKSHFWRGIEDYFLYMFEFVEEAITPSFRSETGALEIKLQRLGLCTGIWLTLTLESQAMIEKLQNSC